MRESKRSFAGILFCILCAGAAARAQDPNIVGFTLLKRYTTNLNGAGVRVGQVEAVNTVNSNDWEANPATIPQPTNLFTWYSNGLSSVMFTNRLGSESGHADYVGILFYGSDGIATNVSHVDNFEANTY
ncbi:MAG TPA: hypothetical protein VGY98_04500, partial [Verrucomicrobiae bacterium]|nr:hypothetical protein [Verrucomicrobiae bacterium]